MYARGPRTQKIGLTVALSLGAVVGLVGCGPELGGADETSQDPGLSSANGLAVINGLSVANGLTAANGLASANGLSAANGLASANGLMTTSDGRMTVSYLVKCALAANDSLVKQDQYNASYTYPGELGLATQWKNGSCDENCMEIMSACMMAHINTTGRHVNLYLDSPVTLGLGRLNNYPLQEGAFFGNIFTTPPKAYYCNGFDFDRAPVAGRIGGNQSGSPYTNPYGACSSVCTTVGANGEAYGSCSGWNNVITTFRDFDPTVPYTICNPSSNMCLDVKGNSTSAGAVIDLWPANGGTNQQWVFERVDTSSPSGKYRIRSFSSGLYLDVVNSSMSNGGLVDQWPNNGGANQQWWMTQVVAGSYLIGPVHSGLLLNTAGIGQGGQMVQSGSGSYSNSQMWKLTLVGSGSGNSGSTGSTGSSSGTPCASFCSPDTVIATQSYGNSNIGTGAACYSTTFPISAMNCGNMTGRTMSVNGTAIDCNNPVLPAKVNGGYCFQATAGGYSYAYFGMW